MSSGPGSYRTWSALSLAPQAFSTENKVPNTPASMLCPLSPQRPPDEPRDVGSCCRRRSPRGAVCVAVRTNAVFP
eukprot:4491125-Prymnesium_polylepis.1